MSPTHESVCIVCGEKCYCCNDTHALGCGASCYEQGPQLEFCSLECALQLQKTLAERIAIYHEVDAVPGPADPRGADLEAIRQRWAKASPGPWTVGNDEIQMGDFAVCCRMGLSLKYRVLATMNHNFPCARDAEAIAHAPSDVAALLEEVGRLQGALRHLLFVVDNSPGAIETARAVIAARALSGSRERERPTP